VPVPHLHIGRCGIILPVCHSISHNIPFQIRQECSLSVLILLNILVHLVAHIRHIYSGIRFPRDIQIVSLVLREQCLIPV
jgi:hypothetical protein